MSLFAQDEQTTAPERIVIGIMGLSRGLDLAKNLVKMRNVVIKYACDPDSKRAASGAKRITEEGGSPKAIQGSMEINQDGGF